MVEDGLYADRTHTGGSTSIADVVWSLVSLILIIGGLVAFYRSFVKDTAQHKRANEPMARIKSWSFWSLIFSSLSFVTYWFAIPAVVSGLAVFMLAIRIDKSKRLNLSVYILAGALAIVSAVVHFILIATAH
jgi:hypothetical protein